MTLREEVRAGTPLEDIDTPALVVEMDALEGNIARMAAAVRALNDRRDSPLALRPHAKSHKSADIARLQVAAGAVGICCQKTSEAEALVAGGVSDVLITNEIVGAAKLARLARLARLAKVSVLADDAGNVAALEAAAAAADARIDVLVEINVGGNRCGVAPGVAAVALAQVIAACKHLRFAGMHAYHGSAQHLRSDAERRAAIAGALQHAAATRDLLRDAGLHCETITGAGTGTFLIEGGDETYTEIQPGSYVFMDADYQRNVRAEGWPQFEQSLFVLTTVMSRPAADRAVVDAGLKASSVDSGMPQLRGWPGVEYTRPADEHGVLRIAPGATAPGLGDRILLVPGHCDPTVNLYDTLVCLRRGRVETTWPVTARGALW